MFDAAQLPAFIRSVALIAGIPMLALLAVWLLIEARWARSFDVSVDLDGSTEPEAQP